VGNRLRNLSGGAMGKGTFIIIPLRKSGIMMNVPFPAPATTVLRVAVTRALLPLRSAHIRWLTRRALSIGRQLPQAYHLVAAA
jgi:hypothetical protein